MTWVQVRLSTTTDAAWKEREAAVLALGAVAEGCISGLLPHLSQIVAFLVPLLEDKRSLVRSITCWTLSRYSKWIVQVNNILVACWPQLLRPTCLDTVCGFAVIGVQGSLCLVKERLFQDDQ
jgi:hypothetical protein